MGQGEKESSDYIKREDMDAKTFKQFQKKIDGADTSDRALLALLNRLKTTNNPTEIRQVSNELERVIFMSNTKVEDPWVLLPPRTSISCRCLHIHDA